MRGMKYDWVIRAKPDSKVSNELSAQLNTGDLVSDLLQMRGISNFEEAKSFFRPHLGQLHDPFLMKDMDLAVNRLSDAVGNNEKILVYGDYDVDGTTSVAMMYTFLRALHCKVEYYQPDRYSEGYGVSKEGIEFAKEAGINLIITLDCGIKAHESIALAKSYGIDVIVCDHHTPSEVLPDALALLDPCRLDCEYPYKGLCGCGVGFKLIQAFAIQNSLEDHVVYSFLDLVCIAIAADIVPVTGENRVLAAYGLQMLHGDVRPGIQALLDISGFKGKIPDITDVVFILAPRINAAGRMAHASEAVQLLIATEKEEAIAIAKNIENHNQKRRLADQQITTEALELIASDSNFPNLHVTVLHQDHWHKGVIGIVASRLIEQYYRPTVVFTGEGELITASARSIPGFNLYDALQKCSSRFVKFGGHTMAAGLTIRKTDLADFIAAFNAIAQTHFLSGTSRPELQVDSVMELSSISLRDYAQIKLFGPFGPDNMTPVFIATGLTDKGSRCVGTDNKHLKMTLTDGSGIDYEGIGFNLGEHAGMVRSGSPLDIVFTLGENEWKGRKSLQLIVKDLRLSNANTDYATGLEKKQEVTLE
jgi:single-stranded-DNA-specific exonuclease